MPKEKSLRMPAFSTQVSLRTNQDVIKWKSSLKEEEEKKSEPQKAEATEG